MTVAGPFVCRCPTVLTMPRFHLPLIEPDVQIPRIRLSDKESRFRPREGRRSSLKPNQPEVAQVRFRVTGPRGPLHLALPPQPLTEPKAGVGIRGFGSFVSSTTAPIATGWSDRCRVGITPTENGHLCTAHTDTHSPP